MAANTPFMNLNLPVSSITSGPIWSTLLNAAMALVDSHNHTQGQGLQIPTAGLNINSDLSANNFNFTTLRSSRFTSQPSALSGSTDLGCVYVAGGDLWYNNGSGAQVQLTSGSVINVSSLGNISGLGGTTGAATYNSNLGTFVWTQNANRAASMDVGSLIVRNPVGTNNSAITIQNPSGTSSYVLTLPAAVPALNSLLQMSNTGVLSAQPWNVDGSGNLNSTGTGTNVQRAGLLQVGTTGNAQLNLFTNNVVRWSVLATGELLAAAGYTPTAAQHVATKNYVDGLVQWGWLGLDGRAGDAQVTLVGTGADTKFTPFARSRTVGGITNDGTGRITALSAGTYRVHADMTVYMNSGALSLYLFVNGVFSQTFGVAAANVASPQATSVSGEILIALNANDYAELWYNTSAAWAVQNAHMTVNRVG